MTHRGNSQCGAHPEALVDVGDGVALLANHIVLGNGSNLVVGGAQGDRIDAGDGYNVILGDAGSITGIDAATGGANRFGTRRLTLGRVETARDNTGGVDTITAGDGTNVILGGAAGDSIAAGDGTNLVLGDGGAITWSADGSFIDSAVSTFADGLRVCRLAQGRPCFLGDRMKRGPDDPLRDRIHAGDHGRHRATPSRE